MSEPNEDDYPFDDERQYTPAEMREAADYLTDVRLGKEAKMLRQYACYVEKFGTWKKETT